MLDIPKGIAIQTICRPAILLMSKMGRGHQVKLLVAEVPKNAIDEDLTLLEIIRIPGQKPV